MSSNAQISLQAPCDGIFMPLAEVPDEAFASGQLGPGIAFEPLGEVIKAPCDGTVVMCATTQHALSVRIGNTNEENAPELLIHLGLDSVELNGQGLELLVQVGDSIKQGAELLRFDADLVASKATSLITPLVLIAGENLRIATEPFGFIAEGSPIAHVSYNADKSQSNTATQPPADEAERDVQVALEAGLHARPAAKLKSIAEHYATRLTLGYQHREVEAGYLSAMMSLGIVQGSVVRLRAQGGNTKAALDDAAALLGTQEGTAAPQALPLTPTPQQIKTERGQITGICASPGLTVAPIVILKSQAIAANPTSQGKEKETQRLQMALDTLRQKLQTQRDTAQQHEDSQIIEAHLAWLDDPGLTDPAYAAISQGASAGTAWQQSLEQQCAVLEQAQSAVIRSRADDLRDLGQRLLSVLENQPVSTFDLPSGAIVIADELTPSQLMQLDHYAPAGLCVGNGGPTSHVAILARARNLPTLVGTGKGLTELIHQTLEEHEGKCTAILDASAGILDVAPDTAQINATLARIKALGTTAAQAREAALEPAYSLDGKTIEVAANIGSGEAAAEAFRQGADGIGLLRSEFLFLDREQAPSIETQRMSYQAALDAAAGKPVIVRLIDIGADKQLPYLDLGASLNPALGIRGSRLADHYAELIGNQLRALLECHSTAGQPLNIMLPMVTDVEDVRAVRTLLDAQIQTLGLNRNDDFVPPHIGVMIEVPAAALCAERLAREVDFFSIGTNDLTQYCLAMDREEDRLASRLDTLHPAVLRLIRLCVEGAKAHDRWVGVCGAAAGDELTAAVLLSLGVDELSTEPARIAAIKASIRNLDINRLATRINRVFELEDGPAVRTWLGEQLKE